MHRTVAGARWLCRTSVTHAVTEAHRPLLRSRPPLWVIHDRVEPAIGPAISAVP
jgi:hypothetical protein